MQYKSHVCRVLLSAHCHLPMVLPRVNIPWVLNHSTVGGRLGGSQSGLPVRVRCAGGGRGLWGHR